MGSLQRYTSVAALMVSALAPLAWIDSSGAMAESPAPKAKDDKGTKGEKSGRAAKRPEIDPALRARLAAFALRQVDFGSISLIPVRFEKSRLAGPFEDGGRILYCVSSRMLGRSLTGHERAKTVIQDDRGVLKLADEDEEVCAGQRTEPFPELEQAARR